MTSLVSFTQFPFLPSEIRIKIWKQAYLCEGPRIIELAECEFDHDLRGKCYEPWHGVERDTQADCRFYTLGALKGLPMASYRNSSGDWSACAAFDDVSRANLKDEISCSSVYGCHSARGEKHIHRRRNSPNSPLFSTNMEARLEVEKLGKLTFNFANPTYTRNGRLTPRSPMYIYLSFHHDILALTVQKLGTIHKLSGCENITKLLLLSLPIEHVPRAGEMPMLRQTQMLRITKLQGLIAYHFPNLKELYISIADLGSRGSMSRSHGVTQGKFWRSGALKMRYITSDGKLIDAPEPAEEQLDEHEREGKDTNPVPISGSSSYGPFKRHSQRFAPVAMQLLWMRHQRREKYLHAFRMVAVQRKQNVREQWGEFPQQDLLEDRRAEHAAALEEHPFWLELDSMANMVQFTYGKNARLSWEVLGLWKCWAMAYWKGFLVFVMVQEGKSLETQVRMLDELWIFGLWDGRQVEA